MCIRVVICHCVTYTPRAQVFGFLSK